MIGWVPLAFRQCLLCRRLLLEAESGASAIPCWTFRTVSRGDFQTAFRQQATADVCTGETPVAPVSAEALAGFDAVAAEEFGDIHRAFAGGLDPIE